MESEKIWESMQARKLPPYSPLDDVELKLLKGFKNNHFIFAVEASQDMEMISSKQICKKCLLFNKFCQVIGEHVRVYDERLKKLTKASFSRRRY